MAQVAQGNTPQNTETQSTAVNTDPSEHTPVEQRVIDAYQSSTDQGLVDFARRAEQNPGGKERYSLNPVSERAAADIKNITGVDTTGNQTVIEQRTVKHILRRHGENGEADHSMRDLNDLGRIQFVLDNYDSAVDGGTTQAYVTNTDGKNRPAKTVVFSKAVNGTYYVVEAVPDSSKKTTYIVSAYMTKNKPMGVQSADASAPTLTAKPEADLPIGTSTVAQPTADVNTESTGAPRFPSAPTDPNAPAKVSETVTTVRDSLATPEGVKQLINDSIEDGGYHYFPITNDATVESAAARIREKGYDSVLRNWTAAVRNGQTGAELAVTGQFLYDAAVKGGDTRLALDILSDYQMLGTNTAQGLQAMRLIKNQTPEGKLYLFNKAVDNMYDSLSDKAKAKLPDGFTINEELVSEYINAPDAKTEQAAYEAVVKDIARQLRTPTGSRAFSVILCFSGFSQLRIV